MARTDFRDSFSNDFLQFDSFSQGHNYLRYFQALQNDFKVIGDLQAALLAVIGMRHWVLWAENLCRKLFHFFPNYLFFCNVQVCVQPYFCVNMGMYATRQG